MIDDEQREQLKWLESVLDNALENELHVVIAMYYPIFMNKINCNFSTLDRSDGVGDRAMNVYQENVDAFMSEGGDFVVWLTGHIHMDYIGYNEQYPKQLFIVDKLSF